MLGPGEINIIDVNNRLKMIEESHPNIYRLWHTTINRKYDDLLKTLKDCDKMLKTATDLGDIPNETIITLLFLQNILKT